MSDVRIKDAIDSNFKKLDEMEAHLEKKKKKKKSDPE
jgi:hypothetical protein